MNLCRLARGRCAAVDLRAIFDCQRDRDFGAAKHLFELLRVMRETS